jgi:EAL domain-containing protein (putative c-di-GMP-specific phosphodiesterase class I)
MEHGLPLQIADLRFLVVEDQGFQRWVLGKTLAKLGARYVFLAPDGQAALKLVTSLDAPVDIVVSDLDMPHMDGMELIRHLSEFGVPVSLIISSGLEAPIVASVETMARAYGINLLGAIKKPVTAQELERVIRLHKPFRARVADATAAAPAFTLEEIVEGLNRDEFEPFFQPKIEVSSGKVRGAEALARWRHPGKGIVTPYAFIKPLEDGGHIDQLTWIMLEKAAACCSGWDAAGFAGTVSVNLSLKSLDDPRVADRVTQIVLSQKISPRDVILEITESATTGDLGGALENLSRLRMKGFGLSIDDYGTGYSSMQQLARIPFTELKIDRSFVRNASARESSRVMLESSLEMASKLNIVAVAEGVEMLVDWELVKRLHCDQAQGYFIAMPMEAGAYLNWIRERGNTQEKEALSPTPL